MVESDKWLSVDDVDTYGRDGVLVLRSVLDGPMLARLQSAVRRTRDHPGGFWYSIYLWRDDDDFRACAWDGKLAAIAAQLLGASKVNLLYDQLFVKPPRGGPTPWHHDLPYWPIEGTSVVSIWLALGEVTPQNGGLEFIRGSHRWERRFRTFSVDYDTGDYTDVVATPDGSPRPRPQRSARCS